MTDWSAWDEYPAPTYLRRLSQQLYNNRKTRTMMETLTEQQFRKRIGEIHERARDNAIEAAVFRLDQHRERERVTGLELPVPKCLPTLWTRKRWIP